jgi:AraC-like DNA-binding protein
VHYCEVAPIPALAGVVQCLWTLQGDGSGIVDPDPVLPDGRPELILHFGDRFDRVDAAGRAERQASVIFAGQLTSQLLLRPTGQVAVLGVRFHPHGAACVLPMPQHELAGLTIGVETLSARVSRALSEIEIRGGLPAATDAVQRVLVRLIQPGRLDVRVRAAVSTIERTGGLVTVDALARAVNMTSRHLERRFLQDVGTTPKRLARITRFQQALRLLQQPDDPARGGADTAAACGYADQSHFIRDFRRLAGCSPSQHLLQRGQLTGFFIDHR